jgi:hypothetical protein
MPFTNPQKKNTEKSSQENEGTREWVSLFVSNDQEISCPERHQHNQRSEVV